MDKKKDRIRLIIYAVIIGGIFIAAFVLFAIARGARTDYSAANVELIKAMNDGDAINIAKYTDQKQMYSDLYSSVAFISYLLTILGLVAFGVCLAISDRIKAKEEEKAGRN